MIKFGRFLSIGGCVGVCRAVGAGFRPQLKKISSADDFHFVRRRNFFRLRCKYARARDTLIIVFTQKFLLMIRNRNTIVAFCRRTNSDFYFSQKAYVLHAEIAEIRRNFFPCSCLSMKTFAPYDVFCVFLRFLREINYPKKKIL